MRVCGTRERPDVFAPDGPRGAPSSAGILAFSLQASYQADARLVRRMPPPGGDPHCELLPPADAAPLLRDLHASKQPIQLPPRPSVGSAACMGRNALSTGACLSLNSVARKKNMAAVLPRFPPLVFFLNSNYGTLFSARISRSLAADSSYRK